MADDPYNFEIALPTSSVASSSKSKRRGSNASDEDQEEDEDDLNLRSSDRFAYSSKDDFDTKFKTRTSTSKAKPNNTTASTSKNSSALDKAKNFLSKYSTKQADLPSKKAQEDDDDDHFKFSSSRVSRLELSSDEELSDSSEEGKKATATKSKTGLTSKIQIETNKSSRKEDREEEDKKKDEDDDTSGGARSRINLKLTLDDDDEDTSATTKVEAIGFKPTTAVDTKVSLQASIASTVSAGSADHGFATKSSMLSTQVDHLAPNAIAGGTGSRATASSTVVVKQADEDQVQDEEEMVETESDNDDKDNEKEEDHIRQQVETTPQIPLQTISRPVAETTISNFASEEAYESEEFEQDEKSSMSLEPASPVSVTPRGLVPKSSFSTGTSGAPTAEMTSRLVAACSSMTEVDYSMDFSDEDQAQPLQLESSKVLSEASSRVAEQPVLTQVRPSALVDTKSGGASLAPGKVNGSLQPATITSQQQVLDDRLRLLLKLEEMEGSQPPPAPTPAVEPQRARVVIVREYEEREKRKPEMKDASTQCTGNHIAIQTDLVPDGLSNLLILKDSKKDSAPPPQPAPSDTYVSPPTPAPGSAPAPPETSPAAFLPYSCSGFTFGISNSTSKFRQQLDALQYQIQQKKLETERIVQQRVSYRYSSLNQADRFIATNRPRKLELWQALLEVDPTLNEAKAKEIAQLVATTKK